MKIENGSIIDISLEDLDSDGVLKIPEGVTSIGFKLSRLGSFLKSVELPSTLTEIEPDIFSLSSITHIKIPETVKKIGENAFKDCKSLVSVKLPKSIDKIEFHSFYGCKNLENVELPENLVSIGYESFFGCHSLENIKIPDSVTLIDDSAFENSNLSEIILPENLKTIGAYCFKNCRNLGSVKFNDKIEEIGTEAFMDCTELEQIELPKSLKTIHYNCFKNCHNLKSVDIEYGSKASFQSFCFENCYELSHIIVPNSVIDFENRNNGLDYYNYIDGGYILSKTKIPSSIPLQELQIPMGFFLRYAKFNKELFNEQKNELCCSLFNGLRLNFYYEQIVDFMQNHSFKFFKKFDGILFKKDNVYNWFERSLFLLNLGVMSTPVDVRNKKVDYAQKVSNFILQKLETSALTLEEIEAIGRDMSRTGFKREFADFFMENFDKLKEIESEKPGFIASCYNDFEIVQQTNTNNHGSQRQLKATVQKFYDYYTRDKFKGITDENRPIAEEVSNYFTKQETFDLALEIVESYKILHTKPHILGEPLKESDVFSTIDDYQRKITEAKLSALSNMVDIANSQFKFEWLAKNDPKNFILGKLCSCCSHLEGAGFGIMHASIVHPNIQNLVIRNKKGRIIAKSTLYINSDEGYGILNNAEVNETYLSSDDCLKAIYQKILLGVNEFATRYNKQHKDRPLKQINIGMGHNDLYDFIEKDYQRETNLLKPINYSYFGTDEYYYGGDSSLEQFVIWENSNPTKEKTCEPTNNTNNPLEKQ